MLSVCYNAFCVSTLGHLTLIVCFTTAPLNLLLKFWRKKGHTHFYFTNWCCFFTILHGFLKDFGGKTWNQF